MAFGGLGAPGTRITKNESEGSERKASIGWSMLFAIAGDVVYLSLLLIVALWGWLSVVPALILAVLGTLMFCFWFLNVPKYFVWSVRPRTIHLFRFKFRGNRIVLFRFPGFTLGLSHEILLKLAFIASVVVGFVAGRWVWNWITASGALTRLFLDVGRGFFFPWYVWACAALMLVVFIAKGKTKAGLSILLVAGIAWIVLYVGSSDEITQSWHIFVSRARYIAVPFVIPWALGSAMLMFVATKNQFFPYLDYTFKPLSIQEARELGMIGLLFPKLFGGMPKEPTPDRLIKVEVSERNGLTRKYADLPASQEFTEFCKGVTRGDSFALRTARGYGLSRSDFEHIRDIFLDRGWASWINPRAKAQGLDLLVSGKKVLREISIE